MKTKLLIATFCIPLLASSQVTLGQKDDFEDYTTRNWTKNNSIPNVNIYDGGPKGTDDNFLRITSSGTGANLNLMTLNNSQWIGNYRKGNGANKITYVSMDVRNSGANVVFLRMSFRYHNPALTTETWSTINPIAVLPGAGWKTINFPIDENSVVRTGGLNDYYTTFETVTETRILHSDVPSWDGKPVETILDIDNIMARNSPMLTVKEITNTEIRIAPNPAKDFIVVQNKENKNFEFRIFDYTGKLIKSGNTKSNEKINLENLQKGNYIIQTKSENEQVQSSEIIKN